MKSKVHKRASELLRKELAHAAADLIVAKGYDAFTVDELARGIGVSRPTFFRYFGSKDSALVASMIGPETEFSDGLLAHKFDPAEPLWRGLKAALLPASKSVQADAERVRGRFHLVESLPMLGAQLRRARLPQIRSLGAALESHGVDAFAAHMLAVTTVAVFDQCVAQWARQDADSLEKIIERAFGVLEAASASGPSVGREGAGNQGKGGTNLWSTSS